MGRKSGEPVTILGIRIQDRRKSLGLTLKALGDICGVHHTYVHSIEMSRKTSPSVDKLLLIARALQTTPNYLLGIGDGVNSADDEAFIDLYLKSNAKNKRLIQSFLRIINEGE